MQAVLKNNLPSSVFKPPFHFSKCKNNTPGLFMGNNYKNECDYTKNIGIIMKIAQHIHEIKTFSNQILLTSVAR